MARAIFRTMVGFEPTKAVCNRDGLSHLLSGAGKRFTTKCKQDEIVFIQLAIFISGKKTYFTAKLKLYHATSLWQN